MANRRYTQFMYSLHKMPVLIDLDILFGASGAVTSFAGLGVFNVIKQPAVGTYRIQLQDNYTQFFGLNWTASAANIGGALAGGSFVVGTTYRILSLGNTTAAQWLAAGVPAGVIPAVGVVFTAATVGAGTGTVQVFAASGVAALEVLGDPSLTLNPQNLPALQGGFVTVAAFTSAGALVNPVQNSSLGLSLYLSNSSSFINGIS